MRSIISDDEPQAELSEASKPFSGQSEEEPIGTKKEEATGDSEGLLRDNPESEALGIEPHEETEKDTDSSFTEWQDIDLVIMLWCSLTYC